ncbi:MAG: nucleotide exchange factor GrpE [Clostridiales bacterium]|jgi:hypothetical protein|nr:nucleotide exchange factor GrpE [Clostridiales bacterium]
MAAKQKRINRLAREDERRHLWESWEGLISGVDGYALKQSVRLFDAYCDAVCTMIVRDAAKLSKLDSQDEYAFTECVELYGAYRRTLEAYENRREALSPEVNRLMEGIGSVLSSRIKQFDDAVGADENADPVKTEKQTVYDKATSYAARRIDEHFDEYVSQHFSECKTRFRQAFLGNLTPDMLSVMEALDFLRDSSLSFCQRGFYGFYLDGLRFCLANLDDLHQRAAARFYFDLAEDEWNVSNDMMKVQVAAIEDAAGRAPDDNSDQSTVQEILSPLREGYQRFSKALLLTRQALKDAESMPREPYLSYEIFGRELAAACDGHKLEAAAGAQLFFTGSGEKKAAFISALDRETDALFDQIRSGFLKTAYRFQRAISDEEFLSEEMIDMFERLRRDLPPEGELPPEAAAEMEILRGITETVEIKIESLKDSRALFAGDGKRRVGEFAAGLKETGYDSELDAYNIVLDEWAARMPNAEYGDMAAFFESCLELGVFIELKNYYEKRENEYQSKIDKAVLNYKKDTLLYEINTYEEILNYSVSRLRESAYEPVARAVKLLDETQASLEMLLKKNNIRPIRPEPREMFNGKEHEVLIAEKQDGYNKGEIIKVLASGYKYKDTVVLRANVIAAK